MDKYEKSLKRLFSKFDSDQEWGYEEEGFLERNHPSIIGFRGDIINCVNWITRVTESNSNKKGLEKHLSHPVWKGYRYKRNFDDWENRLDSYIAGDIYGIRLEVNGNYWWVAPYENGNWARYERLEGKWFGKSVLDYGEEEIKEMWDIRWRWYEEKDNYFGCDKIKEHLWKEELFEESKETIEGIASLIPQSVKDEVEMRKEKMRSVIDGKADFVCDDVWKNLDLEEIHSAYDKKNIKT